MNFIPEIIEYIAGNILAQYFLVGTCGSFFFDLTLYFNEDLRETARKRRTSHKRFTVIYVVSQSIYSGVFGGLLASFVDHALWLSFLTGFFNSLLISFVVKSFLLNSTKRAFWITIGKILYTIVGEPLRKLVSIMEIIKNEGTIEK